MSRFRPIDRDTDYLLPPSVQDWLPESHLARYVVDVVEGLDLSELERAYAGRGSDAYHPALLLSLLIYGYATGTHSSRKIERATYDSLAFRFIACDQHPDHDTLASFRRRFGKEFAVDLRAGAAGGAREPALALWHGEPGRHQDPRQRQPAQRAVVWTRREDRSAAQGRSAGNARSWRKRPTSSALLEGSQPAGGDQAARGPAGGHRRGQGQDRSASEGTLRAGAGRVPGQDGRTRGQGEGYGQEAGRQATADRPRRVRARTIRSI